MIWWG